MLESLIASDDSIYHRNLPVYRRAQLVPSNANAASPVTIELCGAIVQPSQVPVMTGEDRIIPVCATTIVPICCDANVD